MSEILNKEISKEVSTKINIEAGKVIVTALADTKGADVELKVTIDSDYFIDELAKKIPGTIDDAIFSVIKIAIKSL